MTWSTLGERFALTVFGESHGHSVGCVISGCPSGIPITIKEIQKELDLRKPGISKLTTQRKEQDRVEILSGVFNDHTTGSPICMTIKNQDTRSEDYDNIMKTPRPGHADFTAWEKLRNSSMSVELPKYSRGNVDFNISAPCGLA